MNLSRRVNLPPGLRHKISPGLYTMVAQQSTFLRSFGVGLSAFFLYGPVAGVPDHNGFRYLLGPWVCPSLVTAYRTFFPFRPYRGTPFLGRTHDIDREDPAVMRLVEIYRSSEAKRYLWGQTLKLSGVLFLFMGTLAFLLRESLKWSFPYSPASPTSRYWFWMGWIGGCLGSFITLMTAYITWGLMTWGRQEAAISAGKDVK